MEAIDREDGWYLKEGEDVAGPFKTYQDLCDYYMRMDYHYEGQSWIV